MMTTAVVILNWNGASFLQQFLPVLLEHTAIEGVEIVVADNGSTDNSMEILIKNFPTVKTILLDKNYGFAGGYNKALEQIEADYFVLLNSDVEVTAQWLEPLIGFMEENKEVAACQPKILSFFQRTHFEHAGAAGGYIDRFGFPFCRGRIFGETEEDKGQYDDVAELFWASGACMMVRSNLFRKVGGLDEAFFAHMEEIDLCWRFNSRGYKVMCIPQSKVYHMGGGTLNTESPHKTYLNFRNNLLMLYKNLPNSLLKPVMTSRLMFDYLAAFQLFISGKPKNALSVMKARTDFNKMLPDFEEKRKENLLYTTKVDQSNVYQESIVYEYYFKGKKTFNSLHLK
ncbi:MAG: glycosyltransferase family 2 protein [Paludibacter sp.]|nr:glycosyltransferase family 2 protein [Paludibacter sp.]